jgi:hypothetical protein
MYAGNQFSLAEAQSRRGKKSKLLIQWTRFIGCETSVLPILNSIGEVKTSHPLVQSIKLPLTEPQIRRGEKYNLLTRWARFKGYKTSVLSISRSFGEVKTSHPLVQSLKLSLAETQSLRGKKCKPLIQWTRFIGCETSVLPISNSKGEVKTSRPLVQNLKSSLTETQSCQEKKINYHCAFAPLREN